MGIQLFISAILSLGMVFLELQIYSLNSMEIIRNADFKIWWLNLTLSWWRPLSHSVAFVNSVHNSGVTFSSIRYCLFLTGKHLLAWNSTTNLDQRKLKRRIC